jgi:hypothetical protein
VVVDAGRPPQRAAVAGAGLDGLPQLLGDSWTSISAVLVMAANGANSENRPKVGNRLSPSQRRDRADAMKERGLGPGVSSRAMLEVLTSPPLKEAPGSAAYDGRQFVGIDLHRRRSVVSRTDQHGQLLEAVR